MTSKDFLELDHSKIKLAVHEGISFPECFEPVADHLSKVKAMEIRDDDVILCSFPKSGTHWLYRVMDMLRRGQATYVRRNADSTFLDVQDLEAMSQLDSPRILLTHLPFQRLPTQLQDKRTKLVHVYRNPRAVLVSLYFQMKNIQKDVLMPLDQMTVDNVAAIFFSGKLPYGGWFSYMDQAQVYKEQNPEQPIFELSYEEMSQHPHETVAKLGQYLLDKEVSADLCADIVAACSFNKQKASEESSDQSQAAMKFYRKGDMNDWKNYVTVAIDEKFQTILQERKEKCSYSANYCQK